MTVTLYTAPGCPQCVATQKKLDQCCIDYDTRPIDEIRDAAVAKGIGSAPVVAIDGEPAWGGFRPDRIKALVA